MLELIGAFSLETIIIILLVGIPALIKFIAWCKNVYKEREKFKQENINKGRDLERQEEAQQLRQTQIEAEQQRQAVEIAELRKMIKLLIESDILNTRAWIKEQHEKWMPRQCIDSQTLDILSQRFNVYEKEGGNSWAKILVDDLKELPTVTIVPISTIAHQENTEG